MLYFLMKELGIGYKDALDFPAALAYQLQHSHCRANDMNCYFVDGKDDQVNELKNQFMTIPVVLDEME